LIVVDDCASAQLTSTAMSLTIACSRYIHNDVILHAHPVGGESHNQSNATGEVATFSTSFLRHRNHLQISSLSYYFRYWAKQQWQTFSTMGCCFCCLTN